MANLLVVEDDYNTNEAICEYMKMVGHNTLSVFDGMQAVITLQENHMDLVILDIMLPKKDGIRVLKEIREISSIPVLVLTAIENEHTQASCFDAEADDYITKPLSMILLEKRVKALLRRSGKNCDVKQLQLNDIIIIFRKYFGNRKRLAPYIMYDLQAFFYFRGNLTVKAAPPPAVSLTVIVPFSIWVNSLAILSPSPKFDLFVWDLSPL